MPTPPSLTDAERQAINARWLAKLRWVAAAGQLATIAVVVLVLRIEAPAAPLVALVALTAGTNAWFWGWTEKGLDQSRPRSARAWTWAIGGLMLLDLLVLTAMLALTGGPTNPFVIFYFVNVALSAVLLPGQWSWVLNAVAIAAVGALSAWHAPIAELRDPTRLLPAAESGDIPLAAVGVWIAFAACSTVIVGFATRLTTELRRSEEARRIAELLRARSEKLEALGTLAAGAAHELATPLSTIAVVAGELAHELQSSGASGDALADMQLIQQELGRCRTILDRMTLESGQATADPPEPIRLAQLVEITLEGLDFRDRVEVRWNRRAEHLKVRAPRNSLSQALRALVKNAHDATIAAESDAPVRIEVDRRVGADSQPEVVLAVVDEGAGMAPEALTRAGEPFFTTKPPGEGMGLGVFLARTVVERLGGALVFDNHRERGARVTVTLPIDSREPGFHDSANHDASEAAVG